jgi:hypothetical protein
MLATVASLMAAAQGLSAQAALLLEQPYGVFGTLNPTGHAAIYMERVCADTPVRLRLCRPDEQGAVISRYKGLDGYDWVAIPLIPYLYSVDSTDEVPHQVNQETVNRLRERYKEARLGDWGQDLPKGSFFYGGWTELVGTAYDRRTYAFRFDTTPEQDEKLIARFNALRNHSHFNILFNNCADFDRMILKEYFPGKFKRTIFPDAGITTPKRLAYGLVQYSKKHPAIHLTVLEIPQVPGFRRKSRADRGVTESIIANGYVIPIVILNPYVAGGLFADYLARGHYRVIPKNPPTADAWSLDVLLQTEKPSSESGSTPAAFDAVHDVGLPVSGEASVAAHAVQTAPSPATSPLPLPQH